VKLNYPSFNLKLIVKNLEYFLNVDILDLTYKYITQPATVIYITVAGLLLFVL